MLASILIPLLVFASIWLGRTAWLWANDMDQRGKQRLSLLFRLVALVIGTWWLLPAGIVILKLFILREDP
jgi:hypothetical protein